MNSERIHSSGAEKPAWKVEREQDLARKRKMGEIAVGATAAALIIGAVLTHGMKTKEIMDDEERAKNVKKIEVGAIAFHDGVNARKEPYVNNSEPNKLMDIGDEGMSVVVDYDGDGYYYVNENDVNGGWYGFEAVELSDDLVEGSYISQAEADVLKSDEKYGDGTVWFNEKYVTVIQPEETSWESSVS